MAGRCVSSGFDWLVTSLSDSVTQLLSGAMRARHHAPPPHTRHRFGFRFFINMRQPEITRHHPSSQGKRVCPPPGRRLSVVGARAHSIIGGRAHAIPAGCPTRLSNCSTRAPNRPIGLFVFHPRSWQTILPLQPHYYCSLILCGGGGDVHALHVFHSRTIVPCHM